jgi:hypothetical protein
MGSDLQRLAEGQRTVTAHRLARRVAWRPPCATRPLKPGARRRSRNPPILLSRLWRSKSSTAVRSTKLGFLPWRLSDADGPTGSWRPPSNRHPKPFTTGDNSRSA